MPDTPCTVIMYVPAGVFFVPCWPLPVAIPKADVPELLGAGAPLPGVTDAGENVQLAPVGRPPQLRLTVPLKVPPRALTVAV